MPAKSKVSAKSPAKATKVSKTKAKAPAAKAKTAKAKVKAPAAKATVATPTKKKLGRPRKIGPSSAFSAN